MLSAEHQSAIFILFGVVGLLMAVIIGTLVMSQLKRKPRKPAAEEIQSDVPAEDGARVPALETRSDESVAREEIKPAKVKSPEPVAAAEQDVDLKKALGKTEANFFGRIRSLFAASGENTALEDIEEVLYTSDLGPKTVQGLMETLGDRLSRKELRDPESVRSALRESLLGIFGDTVSAIAGEGLPLKMASEGPTVIMIVGVNGAGKTTSIGKISAKAASEGKKVLVAAGDTFRAAAGAQLKVWSDRAQVDIFSPEGVTDPAAVAFDAVSKGIAQNFDLVLIDTAGRLHTQSNLMDELKKVKRVIQKQNSAMPHEVLIVLDANSGQNALIQAKEFHKALTLTGAILTKMDGTAKGGVAVGLVDELGIPVKMIGVGERVRDLRAFSAREYVDSILGL